MSNAIEETLKALTEFESQLDSAKSDAAEAKRTMVKNASEWAEEAKAAALARANEAADLTISKAREQAEAEAAEIRVKGKRDLADFEESLSGNESEAADLVTKRLLGEST
jgi:vacuolar-type H+-ATPase subunit H